MKDGFKPVVKGKPSHMISSQAWCPVSPGKYLIYKNMKVQCKYIFHQILCFQLKGLVFSVKPIFLETIWDKRQILPMLKLVNWNVKKMLNALILPMTLISRNVGSNMEMVLYKLEILWRSLFLALSNVSVQLDKND